MPTIAERLLIKACAEGHFADCLDLPEEERIVSAELIVALGVGQFKHRDWPGWQLHDRGLWLKGAIIPEWLEANERSFPSSLIFERCRFARAVNFADSRIDGRLVLDGCILTGRSDFSDAEITGQFSANAVDGQRAEFSNPDGEGGFGDAIFAHGVKAAGWFMNGARVEGAFNIAQAEITGQFNANAVAGQRTEFINPDGKGGFGNAIFAQGVKAGGWFMQGARVEGAFNINAAEISGQFNASGASFENPTSTSINAEYARIGGGFWLVVWDSADGASLRGLLTLAHARIGTRVQLAGAGFDCGKGRVAIACQMAQFTGRLVMPDRAVRGIIDLSRAHCGTLEDVAEGWPKPLERDCAHCGRETLKREDGTDTGIDIQHLVLDGFTYDHLEFANGESDKSIWQARIDWLSGQSVKALKHEFDPQPWRQCARVLRAMGHDEAAQKISIERRVRERFSDGTSWFARQVSSFLHLVADYGYNPWKGVLSGLFVVLLWAGAYGWGDFSCAGSKGGLNTAKGNSCGGHPAFSQTKYADFEGKEGERKIGYPAFNSILYSFDTFVPLIDFGMDSYWRANAKAVMRLKTPILQIGEGPGAVRIGTQFPIGWLLYVLSVVQIILGSILIAITITGFTGLLTRDDMK